VADVEGLDAGVVLPLDTREAADPARVGPKAATLARLHAAGLPVPDGFCLAIDAYHAHLAAAGIADEALALRAADPEGARRLALRLRLACLRELEPPIAGRLVAAWERLAPAAGPAGGHARGVRRRAVRDVPRYRGGG
jgi:Pyruvate phosphate dikinase, AMP/ATP-binding domain